MSPGRTGTVHQCNNFLNSSSFLLFLCRAGLDLIVVGLGFLFFHRFSVGQDIDARKILYAILVDSIEVGY